MVGGNGETCALHGELFSGLRGDLGKVLAKLDEIQKSQAERRERCASNEGCIRAIVEKLAGTASKESVEAISKRLADVETEQDMQWKSINDLRKLVYIGVGVALAASTLAPIVTGVVVFHLTKG